eukprot:377239_1
MGQRQMSRMVEIQQCPPTDIAQATQQFLERHQENLNTLSPLSNDVQVQEYYLNVAACNNFAPTSGLLGDVSTISLLAGNSGIQFVDWLSVGPLLLGKTVVINGYSGCGKSTSIKYEKARLRRLWQILANDIVQHRMRRHSASDGD